MSLIINIYYTGENGNARAFANDMITKGIVDLREKYNLKMRVEKYQEWEN